MKEKNEKERPEYKTIHFHDGLGVFLSYTERQLEKNQDYSPHPIMRAFNLALTKFEEAKDGENVAGVSGNDGKQTVFVVIQKDGGQIKVLNVIDMVTGNSIPVELIFKLFRLQIKIDSFGGDISTEKLVEYMNEIFIEFHFHYLGDRWVEARDQMVEQMKEGKIMLPRGNDKLVEGLTSIRYNTPWEEYPPSVRGLVGAAANNLFDKRPNSVVISTPPTVRTDPAKVFDLVMMQYLGESSKFFGLNECLFCGEGDDDLEIMSIWDHHLLLGNKFPTSANQLMIVPKAHTRAVCDLPVSHIIEAEELLEAIEEYYSFLGINEYTFIESGFVLQSVYHAHIHAIPSKIDIDSWGMSFKHRQPISSLEDGIDFYKEHGSYIIVKDNDEMTIALPDIGLEDKRSISQLIDGNSWKESSGDEALLRAKKKLFDETCNSWNSWRNSKRH